MTGLSILTSREGFCCIKTNSGNWLWAKGSGLESSFSCYRSAAHGHLARLAVDNLSAWQSLVGFDFVSSTGGSAVAGTRPLRFSWARLSQRGDVDTAITFAEIHLYTVSKGLQVS